MNTFVIILFYRYISLHSFFCITILKEKKPEQICEYVFACKFIVKKSTHSLLIIQSFFLHKEHGINVHVTFIYVRTAFVTECRSIDVIGRPVSHFNCSNEITFRETQRKA